MALWEVVCDTVQSAWKLLTGYSLEEWLHAVGALVLVVLCAFLLAILPLAEWIQAVCSFFLVVLGGILLAVFLLILVYCKPAWLKRVEDFLVTKLKRIATLKTKLKRTGPGFLAEHETLLKQTQDRLRDLEERMDKQESQNTVIGRAEQHTHSRLRVLEERMAKQESQNKEQLMETESQLAKLLWLEIIYVHGAKPLPVGIDTIFKCRYQGDPQTITFAYMNGRHGRQLILNCVQNDDGAMRRSVSFDHRDYHGQWSVGWVERTVLVKQTWNIVIEESRQTLERPCLVLRVDFNAKPTCPVKQHIFGFDACGSNWVLLQTRLCAQTTMKQTTARI